MARRPTLGSRRPTLGYNVRVPGDPGYDPYRSGWYRRPTWLS